jgi:hypothetical protein
VKLVWASAGVARVLQRRAAAPGVGLGRRVLFSKTPPVIMWITQPLRSRVAHSNKKVLINVEG